MSGLNGSFKFVIEFFCIDDLKSQFVFGSTRPVFQYSLPMRGSLT